MSKVVDQESSIMEPKEAKVPDAENADADYLNQLCNKLCDSIRFYLKFGEDKIKTEENCMRLLLHLQETKDKLAKEESSNKDLTTKNATLQLENQQLKKQIQVHNSQMKCLKDEIVQLEKANMQKIDTIQVMNYELEICEAKNEEVQMKNQNLQADVQRLVNQNEQLRCGLDEKERQLVFKTNEFVQAQNEIMGLNSVNHDLNRQLAIMTAVPQREPRFQNFY